MITVEDSLLIPSTVLTFSLLTPVILPIATVAFGSASLAYQHILLYLANIVVDTRGRLYFPAFFHLFVGLYAQQLTFIGLFVLKFDPQNRFHDLGQLTVLVVTLLLCVQYHVYLKRRFGPSVRHHEASVDSPHRPIDPPRLSPPGPPRVASTPKSDAIEGVPDLSADSQAIIWLPKDRLGISRSLQDYVRAKYFADSADVVRMVDSDTCITEDGMVTVGSEGVSLVELPRLTSKS